MGKDFIVTLGKARKTIERLREVKEECKALVGTCSVLPMVGR